MASFEWTLPARDYCDPVLFERERQEIFARNWMLFTWSARLASPGDYVSGTTAGFPVFAIRDDDGRIRAFHNVCRHRGAQLLTKAAGQCGKLVVCPYHSWSYRLDGRLQKAADFGGDLRFDPEAWGLYAFEAEEWRGLVFLRLRSGGPSLIDWLGPIHDMAASYPLEQQLYFTSKDRDCAVDWKTYGENYLECYHCRVMHPGLCASMDIDAYRIDTYAADKLFHLHSPKREGGLTRGLYFYRFPFLMLNLYDWGSSIATIEPIGAGRIRHINWYFFTDVSAEKADENARNAAWSAQIVTEDLDIITGVQRNLEAGIYTRGPLSPKHEGAVKAFQDMVRDGLSPSEPRLAAE